MSANAGQIGVVLSPNGGEGIGLAGQDLVAGLARGLANPLDGGLGRMSLTDTTFDAIGQAANVAGRTANGALGVLPLVPGDQTGPGLEFLTAGANSPGSSAPANSAVPGGPGIVQAMVGTPQRNGLAGDGRYIGTAPVIATVSAAEASVNGGRSGPSSDTAGQAGTLGFAGAVNVERPVDSESDAIVEDEGAPAELALNDLSALERALREFLEQGKASDALGTDRMTSFELLAVAAALLAYGVARSRSRRANRPLGSDVRALGLPGPLYLIHL